MFDFWQKPERSTSEVYLRTDRENWFDAVATIARELPVGRLVDIGAGDLHSTRQILARAPQITVCDIVEPNPHALSKARRVTLHSRIGNLYQTTLADFQPERMYAGAMCIHANYYWGKTPEGWSDAQYEGCIDKIASNADAIFILGASQGSEYYDLVGKNPFPEHVHIENTKRMLSSRGKSVTVIPSPMRFYVGDLRYDDFAAVETWKFFNNTEEDPSVEEMIGFLKRIGKRNHVTFGDELLIAK